MSTIELTAANFETTVEADGIVLVDWWASWCGPCMRFGPTYEAASTANADIVFAKVDTEAEQALAGAAQITSIPTLNVYSGGQLVKQIVGAKPKAALLADLADYL